MIKELAKKWYIDLGFEDKFDVLFDKILEREDIAEALLDKTCAELEEIGDREACLIYALSKCEELEKKYSEAGISNEIFMATISDIKVWTLDYYDRTNIFGLDQVMWIERHLAFTIFKLGRLQFEFSPSLVDCPEKNLKKGDNTLVIHITRNEPFTPEKWEESFKIAKEFFE